MALICEISFEEKKSVLFHVTLNGNQEKNAIDKKISNLLSLCGLVFNILKHLKIPFKTIKINDKGNKKLV